MKFFLIIILFFFNGCSYSDFYASYFIPDGFKLLSSEFQKPKWWGKSTSDKYYIYGYGSSQNWNNNEINAITAIADALSDISNEINMLKDDIDFEIFNLNDKINIYETVSENKYYDRENFTVTKDEFKKNDSVKLERTETYRDFKFNFKPNNLCDIAYSKESEHSFKNYNEAQGLVIFSNGNQFTMDYEFRCEQLGQYGNLVDKCFDNKPVFATALTLNEEQYPKPGDSPIPPLGSNGREDFEKFRKQDEDWNKRVIEYEKLKKYFPIDKILDNPECSLESLIDILEKERFHITKEYINGICFVRLGIDTNYDINKLNKERKNE